MARQQRTFMGRIQKRFFLRFHMSLILLATALSGVLTTKFLLLLDVKNIVIRYPLAVITAYLAFFCFVKLWLRYVTSTRPIKGNGSKGDILPDLSTSSGGSGPSASGPSFKGGGGGTGGGGGASGSFDGPTTNAQAAIIPPQSGTTGSSSGGALGKAGDALSGGFDDDTIVLAALAVLLAATLGGAIYLIYIAPHILSEAAFDFLLGAGLIRSYRKMNRPDWMGSVFRDTYKPFLIVLVVAVGAAWVIHSHDPSITKLSDIFAR